MLREALYRIGTEYWGAAGEKFASHPVADYIRRDARGVLERATGHQGLRFKCKGSAGAGRFAAVPWLAIFDGIVTDAATRGYYVVYLFSSDGHVFLSLNQGTTAVRQEFGTRASEILVNRAVLMRARLPDFSSSLQAQKIRLNSNGQLPRDYESGHAMGCAYTVSNLTGENQLNADLHNAISAYTTLAFRGGLEASSDTETDDGDIVSRERELVEVRKYRMHRTIERNQRLAELAKVLLGTRCQVCEFDFFEAYGSLGEGYIEAHHLQPLSSLEEGVPVALDPIKDFAVLCSNCHRMIHRTEAPSDLRALRNLLRCQKG